MELRGEDRREAVQQPTGSRDIGPREEARLRGRRWAAEAAGAIEGFVEGMERFELEHQVEGALHESSRLVTNVSAEARHQARSPEGRRLARDARHQADAVGSRASSLAHDVDQKSSQAAQTVRHKANQAADYIEEQWDDLKENVSEGTHRVQEAAQITAAETKQRGRLVAESGRRAAKAPGHVMADTKKAMGAWKKGLAGGFGLMAAAGIVGLAAFVVLTIALVNGLNILVGAPGGTFIVALLYAVAAGGALYGARAARRRGHEATQRHMDDARTELIAVVRPLREAFSTHRVAQAERPSPRRDIGRVKVDDSAYDAAIRHTPGATGEGGLASSIDEREDDQKWNRR